MTIYSPDVQQRILQLQQLYADRKWPEEWLCDVLRDFHIWSAYNLRRTGTYTVADHLKGWFDQIFSGRIIRIGRLMFDIEGHFGGRIVVFRKGGKYTALAEDGLTFNQEGLRDEKGWRSVLRCDGGVWVGNKITGGRAEQQLTCLDSSEWKTVLKYEDPMIGIHIPEDGPMTPDACRRSLKTAAEWFLKEESAQAGFCCQSWFLNPVLSECLPPDSNIMQFQKLGHLYPMGNPMNALDRLYPGKLRDFIVSRQDAGCPLKCGGLFLLKQEIRQLAGSAQFHAD